MTLSEPKTAENELRALVGRISAAPNPQIYVDQMRVFDLCFDLGLIGEAHALNLALYGRVGTHPHILRNHLGLIHALAIPDKAKQLEEQLAAGNLGDRELRRLGLAARKPRLGSAEYASELAVFLGEFGDDGGAWAELADVYQTRRQFDQAIHCCEELLLLEPNNARTYQRLGELHFSLARPEQLLLAAKHFAFVLGLSPGCYRALKAMELVARALQPSKAEHAAAAGLIVRKLLAARQLPRAEGYK